MQSRYSSRISRIAHFGGTTALHYLFWAALTWPPWSGLTGVVSAVVTPLGHLRRSTLDHAHAIYPSIHLIHHIFPSIHPIHPIQPSFRACYPTIQPNQLRRRPRHAPSGRRSSRRGCFWPQNSTGGSRLCWRRDGGLDLMRADLEIKWPQWKRLEGPISRGQ